MVKIRGTKTFAERIAAIQKYRDAIEEGTNVKTNEDSLKTEYRELSENLADWAGFAMQDIFHITSGVSISEILDDADSIISGLNNFRS